jgi:hypothetical protein
MDDGGVGTVQDNRRGLRISLWVAQTLVAVPFVFFGAMKLFEPIPKLAQAMAWTGDLPEVFVRMMGVIDLLGGAGIILPSLTKIYPRLTVWAALGCALLQICAGIFHASRGEFPMLPGNLIFLVLSVFVYWGRGRVIPVERLG